MLAKKIHLPFVLLIVLLPVSIIYAQVEPTTPLEVGKPEERELKGGESHSYILRTELGYFVDLAVDQRGIDVVVSLFGPDGRTLAEVDSPNGDRGLEPIVLISGATGQHRVEIKSLENDAGPGRYEIKLIENRLAVDRDREILKARIAVADGVKFSSNSSKDSQFKAVEKYKDAIRIYQDIAGSDEAIASLLVDVGQIYDEIGESEKGIPYFRDATILFNRPGTGKSRRVALAELGLLLKENGQFDEALEVLHIALTVAKEAGDQRRGVSLLNWIALVYHDRGQLEKAVEVYNECLAKATELHLDELTAAAHNNLGNAYDDLGNSALAVDHQNRQIEIGEKLRNKEIVSRGLLNLGSIRSHQMDYSAAVQVYEKSLKLAEERGDRRGQQYAHNNLGLAYERLDNYSQALQHELRALALDKELGNGDEPTRINVGLMYLKLGDTANAILHFNQVIETSKDWKDRSTYAEAVHLLAETYCVQANFQKCADTARIALDTARQSNFTARVWKSLNILSTAQIALDQIGDARKSLEEAIAVIEDKQRKVEGSPEARQRYFFDKLEPYYALVELLASRFDPVDALEVSERIKARTLLDVLQNGRLAINKTMSPSETVREEGLKRELVSLNVKLNNESDEKRSVALEKLVETKRSEFDDFRNLLYAAHPELKALRGGLIPIKLIEGAKLLTGPDSAILEFAVSEKSTVLFVVTISNGNPALKAYQIKVDEKVLVGMVAELRKKLAAGDMSFVQESKKLYELLVKPAEFHLKEKSSLLVVPDGCLWELPFQALQDAKGNYLIQNAALSYAPSLTALIEMRKKASTRRPSIESDLLAFGNPIISKNTIERVQRVFMGEKLEPIPDAGRLANELGKMYGPTRSKIYTGAAAREATAKSEAPKYRIVQFATHGILNDVSPMYSHLVLAQDEKDPNEDGLLEAWELKDLDLKADMVILSACDTARGRVSAGEGMIGMTWAAFIAGAPTTVASQWKVESSSTTELMLEFHRQLLSGKVSKAEALRRAQLKLMRIPKYKHPLYWAGWVIVGDGS